MSVPRYPKVVEEAVVSLFAGCDFENIFATSDFDNEFLVEACERVAEYLYGVGGAGYAELLLAFGEYFVQIQRIRLAMIFLERVESRELCLQAFKIAIDQQRYGDAARASSGISYSDFAQFQTEYAADLDLYDLIVDGLKEGLEIRWMNAPLKTEEVTNTTRRIVKIAMQQE